MSEYTDYLIYRTDAPTLAALQAEVAAEIGRAVIIPFAPDQSAGDEAVARAIFEQGPRPKWVALLAERPLEEMSSKAVAQITVLEDFASWRLALSCGGTVTTLRFGGADGYAAGWFAANLNEPAINASVAPETLAYVAACTGLSTDRAGQLLTYDRPWAFLDALGAPSIQMLDSQLAVTDWDDVGEPGEAVFDWDAGFDE
jgi:hypothetical protein